MSLDVWIVGPELGRAQVVRYHAGGGHDLGVLAPSLRLPAPDGATDGFL